MPELFFSQEDNWAFMAHQALMLVVILQCPLNMPVRDLLLDTGMSLVADSKSVVSCVMVWKQ